ncbi:hypothetical protein [Neomesorhizobium albiziae]|uniref:hypothetical protein n=1 Tax=Neomesorhizobium albiziae TaxID=335020 RepID=UPI00122CBAF4|nr:hypothetical protein [Mesorhizobium albiziae]
MKIGNFIVIPISLFCLACLARDIARSTVDSAAAFPWGFLFLISFVILTLLVIGWGVGLWLMSRRASDDAFEYERSLYRSNRITSVRANIEILRERSSQSLALTGVVAGITAMIAGSILFPEFLPLKILWAAWDWIAARLS